MRTLKTKETNTESYQCTTPKFLQSDKRLRTEPPQLICSNVAFMNRKIVDGEQAAKAKRNISEIAAS
jgi:hypothetical protein